MLHELIQILNWVVKRKDFTDFSQFTQSTYVVLAAYSNAWKPISHILQTFYNWLRWLYVILYPTYYSTTATFLPSLHHTLAKKWEREKNERETDSLVFYTKFVLYLICELKWYFTTLDFTFHYIQQKWKRRKRRGLSHWTVYFLSLIYLFINWLTWKFKYTWDTHFLITWKFPIPELFWMSLEMSEIEIAWYMIIR